MIATLQPTAAPTQAPTRVPTATNAAQPPTAAPTNTEPPTAVPSPAATATPNVVYITYQDFEIVPAQTTIKVGTRVVFLIKSASHMFHQPYTFDQRDPFQSAVGLGDGTTFAHTFNVVGTFTIACGYHNNMVASVTVIP
jgi:plastocyanin